MLSRYLVENDDDQKLKLDLEKTCENDVIFSIFTQLVGRFNLLSKEKELAIEIELCEVIIENLNI